MPAVSARGVAPFLCYTVRIPVNPSSVPVGFRPRVRTIPSTVGA